MGRNRRKAGAGFVEALRYDIFGNVTGETTPENSAPAEQEQEQIPVPAPEGYTVKRVQTMTKNVEYDRNAPYEILTMLDDNGNVIYQKKGGSQVVQVTRTSEVPWQNAAVITHNHPSASSFSSDDFIAMHERGLSGLEARSPVFTSAKERAFVNEVIAMMVREMRVNALRLDPFANRPEEKRFANKLARQFEAALTKELARFAKSKRKSWRFVVVNPDAVRNPPEEQRLNANTSTEEMIAMFITGGQSRPNPNNRIVGNVGIPRRKQILTDALKSQSNLRNFALGVQLSLQDSSSFWRSNPEKAKKISTMIINAMLSHASNVVALKESTYKYDVSFD